MSSYFNSRRLRTDLHRVLRWVMEIRDASLHDDAVSISNRSAAKEMFYEFFKLLGIILTEVTDIAKCRFAVIIPIDSIIDRCRVAGDFIDIWYGSCDRMQGCWSCSDAHRRGK
jgi:hypothetical protein